MSEDRDDGDPSPTDRDPNDALITRPDAVDRVFDWRGWALVGAIFVAFVAVPGIIYLYPHAPSSAQPRGKTVRNHAIAARQITSPA